MLQSGTIDPEASHTRIPGIWAKLRTLYDLEQLNEREDAIFTSLDDKAGSYWRDFELVGGDGDEVSKGENGSGEAGGFEALMWERRLAPEGTPGGSDWGAGSPGTGAGDEKAETSTATDEARSSPVPSTLGRGTRSGGRKGRVNVLKDEMEVDSSPVGSGRASRRTSKAASEVDEDQVMEDADDDDEDGEGDESGSSSDDQDDGDDRRGSIAKRGRGGRRGRGKRGRRRG